MTPEIIFTFLLGSAFGAGCVWAALRLRMGSSEQWSDRFKAIAAETLRQSHESFLQLAESRLKQSEVTAAAALDKKQTAIDELIKPVKDTLSKMDAQLKEIEIERHGAYKELMQAVTLSNETQQKLRSETSLLLQALRTPTTRGRWGEIQVRRILEMTGMTEHTQDFSSQHHINADDGALRPDYVVRLPGERCVIIDSKVPMDAYLDGVQTDSQETRAEAMKLHARKFREHIRALSAKAYWDQIEGSADFVVLFVPGDHFLSGALDADPELIEYGTAHNVILATPVTLVALLRTVALSWRQENLRENARKLGELGGEVYNAVAIMTDHISDLGRKLTSGVDSYNKMIGSMERNVLSKARRLRDFGADKEGKALPDGLSEVDIRPRTPQLVASTDKEDAA